MTEEPTWRAPSPIPVPAALREAVGGHPLVAASLAQRGILTPAAARSFLDPAAYAPAPAADLPDIDAAVACVRRVIHEKGEILVWGDFDVDGQTATTLLVSALRELGAFVRWHIPNRFREGHGVHLPTLQRELQGADLLLTCDTGIGAHDSLAWAQAQGVAVVVTDHHKLPATLPPASAIVSPQRLAEGHALRELPGVGTAFKLIEALFDGRSSEHLLDLVALGIVADVMRQVDDTRWLLQRGLQVLRAAERPGLRALMAAAGVHPTELTESDVGFALAPRLNALGRLDDANVAVNLLTSRDAVEIDGLVRNLEALNQKRRFLTRQVHEAAQQQIAKDPSLLDYAALVLCQPGWHTGVVGIVASRLVEEYGRPAILLGEQGGLASGSARSLPGCDIVAALDTQAGLLQGYGGHSMAAGMRLNAARVSEFRRGLSRAVREQTGEEPLTQELQLDADLKLGDVTLELAQQLARLAPFGNGNPPLTLVARDLQLLRRRTLDRRGDHLELTVANRVDAERRVIWWSGDAEMLPQGRFDLAFTLRVNVYRGQREALMEWLGARSIEDEDGIVLRRPTWEALDYRRHPAPLNQLTAILADDPAALVWREGHVDLKGVDRMGLRPAETLAVWTVPPDADTWKAALNTVAPQRVLLFAYEPPWRTPQALIERVAGLAKYALQGRAGRLTRDELAALTAQPLATVQTCIDWLNVGSRLRFTPLNEDEWRVTRAPAAAPLTPDKGLGERLGQQMRETAAWRRYWLRQSFPG